MAKLAPKIFKPHAKTVIEFVVDEIFSGNVTGVCYLLYCLYKTIIYYFMFSHHPKNPRNQTNHPIPNPVEVVT